jgi:threonine dehydrogenase-like Zn-dependent dehydrogenase
LNGRSPNIVIDTTGNAKVFAGAQALAATYGRIVVFGDTGSPVSQHLTADTITRGLQITGAHDLHNTPEWNATRIYGHFFSLIKAGRFNLDKLITHTMKPDDCSTVYNDLMGDRRGETMGIAFDWSGQE